MQKVEVRSERLNCTLASVSSAVVVGDIQLSLCRTGEEDTMTYVPTARRSAASNLPAPSTNATSAGGAGLEEGLIRSVDQ